MGSDGACLTNNGSIMAAVAEQRKHSNDDGGATGASEVKVAEREATCQECRISRQRLWPPIVADRSGRLFLRSAFVELLLSRKGGDTPAPPTGEFASLKKMSQVTTLAFKSPADVTTAIVEGRTPPPSMVSRLMVCPITDANLSSGAIPFGFWWECGHVIAQKARGDGSCALCGVGTSWVPIRSSGAVDETEAKPAKQHRTEQQ